MKLRASGGQQEHGVSANQTGGAKKRRRRESRGQKQAWEGEEWQKSRLGGVLQAGAKRACDISKAFVYTSQWNNISKPALTNSWPCTVAMNLPP